MSATAAARTLSTPSRGLRLGYAALAIAMLALAGVQAAEHGAWIALAAGLIAPDLPLALAGGRDLGPGRIHPRAVPLYNAVHRIWAPAALLAIAAIAALPAAWLVAGLAWAAHIAVDRAAGFGLRTPDGYVRGA